MLLKSNILSITLIAFVLFLNYSTSVDGLFNFEKKIKDNNGGVGCAVS
jgi:hypothetical protein